MSLKKKIKSFFTGAFDYYQPTAGGGCCGCVEVDPGIRKEYRDTKEGNKNKNIRTKKGRIDV